MTDTSVVVEPKPWYASKTIIVNGLTIAAALIMFLISSMNAGELPFALDAKWTAFILGIINFALRWLTVAPVQGGPGAN